MKLFHIMKSSVDKLKPGVNISTRFCDEDNPEYDGGVSRNIVSKYMTIYFVNKADRFFAIYFIKLKTTGKWRVSYKLSEESFWRKERFVATP